MTHYTHNGRKIETNFIYPPIPDRSSDWCATFDDYDGDPTCPRGWGATEKEAVRDLIEQVEAENEPAAANTAEGV